jgi:hypothetical protein
MTNVTFEEHSGHLEVSYTGSLGFSEVMGLLQAISEHAATVGQKHVLLDVTRSTGDLSVADRYRVGDVMARRWERSVRLAVLLREEHLLPDRFWVTVTRNRGLSTDVFTERDSAIEWLLE